jgi:hypothetical protein
MALPFPVGVDEFDLGAVIHGPGVLGVGPQKIAELAILPQFTIGGVVVMSDRLARLAAGAG